MSTKTVKRPKKTTEPESADSFRSGAGSATATTATRSLDVRT